MISELPYPENDERNRREAWTEVRIHSEISPQLREALHELLDASTTIEAQHGYGTPILEWRTSAGERAGYGFYIRLIRKPEVKEAAGHGGEHQADPEGAR